MKLIVLLLSLALSLLVINKEISLVHGEVGTAAVYGPPYLPTACYGNSHDQFPAGNLFAAVGEGLWDNGAACGRRYRLRCLSGINRPCRSATIDVKVIHFCPTCSATISLSTDAFPLVSRFNEKINIEYKMI